MKKLVSIIVSIYNEEKYIDKSGYIIDSLMEKAIEWIYLETHFDEPRSMVIRKTLEFKKPAKTGGIRYSVVRKKLECIHTLQTVDKVHDICRGFFSY